MEYLKSQLGLCIGHGPKLDAHVINNEKKIIYNNLENRDPRLEYGFLLMILT